MSTLESTVVLPDSARSKPRPSLDTVSIWALLSTLILALFIIAPSVSVSSAMVKTYLLALGALVTLVLYILARLSRGNSLVPPPALIGVLWLPPLAYALSAAFSGGSFTNAFWGIALEPDTLGFMLVVAVLGSLTALMLRRSEHYRAFLTVGAYALAAVVIAHVLIIISGQFMPNTISPSFSLVGSYGDLATLLGLGVIALLIALRFLPLGVRPYRMLLATLAGALFLLAVANAPLVWVLLALVSLGLFVEAVMNRSSKYADTDFDENVTAEMSDTGERTHSPVLPLAVLAVSIFFLIGGTLGGALANALHVNILNIRPSWQSTFAVAEKTYASAPVFGSGPGTFGVEWLKYRDAGLNSTIFWNIDFTSGVGFIPTSFVTTGLAGVLAWLAFLGLFVALGLRMLILRTPEDAYIRYAAITAFLGALYLFATATFDLPSSVILALAFVFAGLFASLMRFGAQAKQRGIVFSQTPRLGFVIVFSLTILLLASVVAAYALATRYLAATALSDATMAFSTGNLDRAGQAALSSVSFVPSAIAYQVQAGIANARLNLIAASTTMDKSAAQQAYQMTLSGGINAALSATNQSPSDYRGWLALGNLYAQAVPLGVSGSYASAKAAYGKAQSLNPTNPQIPYILAQLDIANKDAKAAEADLKAAISLKPDYTAAIFLLSQLEVADGNVKDALTTALAAAYFEPNNPNILFQVGILYAAQNDFKDAAAALSAAVAANGQFANARYFLSASYAKLGDMGNALKQMQAIADISSENASMVSTQLGALKEGKNPFPANLLSASPEVSKP